MLIVSYFSDKGSDISCESSASQTIHMKCQALFSLKKKKKKKKKTKTTARKQRQTNNRLCLLLYYDWRFKGKEDG